MLAPLSPDDRVLVLQTHRHSTSLLREWAQTLTAGVLVGLGDRSAISIARKELADCENAMFSVGSRNEIPWLSGYFTVIVDAGDGAGPLQATDDMRRVLHPSGRIYSIQP